MITPAKHLDLDVSVLRAGAIALAALKAARVMPLPKLRDKLVAKLGDDAELIFMPTVNFLFLLGRIEYHVKNDSLEYLNAEPSRAPSATKERTK